MIVKDVLATLYTILDHATEQELSLVTALEHFASMQTKMQYEQIFGYVDEVVRKSTVTFDDTTGIEDNTLEDFGEVVHLSFNNDTINECPVSLLEEYAQSGLQRVAFWTDEDRSGSTITRTNKIQLAIPQMGALEVWYEPYTPVYNNLAADVQLHSSLKYCLAWRLADICLPYVKYDDSRKELNKPALQAIILREAEQWKKIYLEKVSRYGTSKTFSKLPFMAGISCD